MYETISLILMVFLAFTVCAACLSVSFMAIDMIFSHRISESLRVWYNRKFKV